jgi:hypothetical protein
MKSAEENREKRKKRREGGEFLFSPFFICNKKTVRRWSHD